MTALLFVRYTPTSTGIGATVAYASDVVRHSRRLGASPSLWITTVGGDSTFHLTSVVQFDSLADQARFAKKLWSDPEMMQMMTSERGSCLAHPQRVSLFGGMAGYDQRLAPPTDEARSAFIYISAVHPAIAESQAAVHALSARHGMIHSASVGMVTGTAPSALIAAHVAPNSEALAAGLDGILSDPEWPELQARFGQFRLGASIMREVVVD